MIERAIRYDKEDIFVNLARKEILDEYRELEPDDPEKVQAAEEQKEATLKAAKEDRATYLRVILDDVLDQMDESKRNEYFDEIAARSERTADFLSSRSRFNRDQSFLLLLREWNSFTPAVPIEGEEDRGGGYFIFHSGHGVVIDPGYDFIYHFSRAGGRIHDIDHIIVTHAHNDHTAEFESLLVLIHEYNDKRKERNEKTKQVKLYLSLDAQQKLSGLIPLERKECVKSIIVLNRAKNPTVPQKIDLFPGGTLTVLPAYHDDQMTCDYAVGLGLEIDSDNGTKRIVFTGDTGICPKGAWSEHRAVYNLYPEPFRHPEPGSVDLVIAHIGSIQEQEFEKFYIRGHEAPQFYKNHLGMLGTIILLDQLQPKAAFISEFGQELKNIRTELVDKLAQALSQKRNREEQSKIHVFPGDVSMVYDINTGLFLCHNTCEFEDPERLKPWSETDDRRVYLFNQQLGPHRTENAIKDYKERLKGRRLPCCYSDAEPDS
ncbi:MAG: MBL fold metallo-hydrolase [Deltaproteobacteria bacterium]|nr:MBL fold metallo-hydrolase [Deltaproteobacteria bacterium]